MFTSVAVIIIGTELILLGFILMRKHLSPRGGHFTHIESAGAILGVIGTGYAVLLAFVIFSAFDSYQTARRDAGVESVATRQLFVTAEFFAEANRDQLQGDLVCYGRAVIHQEWPLMSDGVQSPVVDGWLSQIDQDLVVTPIATNKETEAIANWFAQSRDRQDGRRGRLAESVPYVPPFVWAVLVLFFLVVIGYQALFADPTARLFPQLLGMAAVGSTLLAGMVVVYVLDAPFADRGAALSPNRMQASVQLMEADYQDSARPLRCDATGLPNR